MTHPMRTAALAAITCAALVTACGDDVLGPPDGPFCTAGFIQPGDSVTSHVTAASCEAFDPDDYQVSNAESWTLQAKKNTAYVVRMYHVSDEGSDNLDAYLQAYRRGPSGEATFITSDWDNFGASNPNGGSNREMFILSDRDADISLRVQTNSSADTGAYALVVRSCPVTVLNDTTTHTGIALGTGCTSLSYDNTPTTVRFFTFSSDSGTSVAVNIHRTAGEGTFASRLFGPGPDVACWNDDCVSTSLTYAADAALSTTFDLPGRMGVLTAVHSDSVVTATVAAVYTAPATAARRTP